MTDPTTPPEGQQPAETGPDWSAFEQAGITPDRAGDVINAWNMAQGLQNLDTRGQVLQQIVNPQYDGQFLQGMMQPQQSQDPWDTYNQQFAPEQQYYEEPQAPAFDPAALPQMLDPVFQQRDQQLEQRVFERLQSMAQDQAIKDSASKAAEAAGLPPNLSALIENYVRETSKTQMNAQPGQLAQQYAKQLQTELLQWKATPPATPAPTAQIPGGPAPDTLQKPKTFEEALEYSKQILNS